MAWQTRLLALPNLTAVQKGDACNLIMDRPDKDRELLVAADQDVATACILKLLRQGTSSARWYAERLQELPLRVEEKQAALVALSSVPEATWPLFFVSDTEVQVGNIRALLASKNTTSGGMDDAVALLPGEIRRFMEHTTSTLNALTNITYHTGAMVAGMYRFRSSTHADEALKLFSTGRKRTGSDGSGSETSSTRARDRAKTFRSDSLEHYGLKHADGSVMCQVTGCYWPAPFVSCGHIAPNHAAELSKEYLHIEPDNPRNSFTWIEPIEAAVGSGKVCVVMVGSKLTLKVTDAALLDTELVDYGSWRSGKTESGYTDAMIDEIEERLKDREACLPRPQAEAGSQGVCSSQSGERSEEDAAASVDQPTASSSECRERSKQPVTFRDLQYRPLCFNNERRPYARALSTAALRAHKVHQPRAPELAECNYWMHSPSLPNATKCKVMEWLHTAGMTEAAQQVSFSVEPMS